MVLPRDKKNQKRNQIRITKSGNEQVSGRRESDQAAREKEKGSKKLR
jgi:hypothetical protein